MPGSYTPVQYEYREVIEEQITAGKQGKVFYFNESDEVDCAEGSVIRMIEIPQRGIYIILNTAKEIRIDRIITLFGKPGAAYDEYDSYANQCLSCTGGYDL